MAEWGQNRYCVDTVRYDVRFRPSAGSLRIAQPAARPRLDAKSRPIAEFVACLAGQRDMDALSAVCVPGHGRRSLLA